MEDLQETSRLVSQGATHVVTTSVVAGSTLRVEVETEEGRSRWCGEFAARYVEGITQKTGSAKKFPVFVKMLLDALGMKDGSSESVFVDLLTYADLELLKARRAGHVHQKQQTSGGSRGNNKRYLILTYAAEYDRVHYPLPLAYVETPEREQLERTIDRLREDLSRRPLEAATSSARNNSTRVGGGVENARGPAAQLLAENAELRRRVGTLTARLEGSEALSPSPSTSTTGRSGGEEQERRGSGLREVGPTDGGGEIKRLRRAYEELQTQLDDLREAHERLKLESASEIRKLNREVREGAKAVEDAAMTAGEAEDKTAGLREELEACERDLTRARQKQLGLRKQVATLDNDLAKERESSRAMRTKLRQMSSPRGRTAASTAAAAGPRAYGQPWQGRKFSSPSGARGGTTGARSAIGRSRSAASSRRLVDSSSTNRSGGTARPAKGVSTPGWKQPRPRLGRAASTTTRTPTPPTANGSANATTGAIGFGRGRSRRADSPLHAPYPNAFSKWAGSSGTGGDGGGGVGGGGGGGGSGSRGPSSRGSSPASSRGRSRSRSAGSTGRGGRGVVAPPFDPTAYQRQREARLRRLEEDRRRRERREIGYSPARSSGRDSWMGSSGERKGMGSSLAGAGAVQRGRSAVRGGGGRSSGYSSAASQASRASRGSSTRSRLSLSAPSDASPTSQHRHQRRRRRRTTPATRRSPSPAAATASPATGGPPPRRPSAATSATRGGSAGASASAGGGSGRKYSAAGKFETAPSSRRSGGGLSSRLYRSGGGGGAAGYASPSGRRREAPSPTSAKGGSQYGGWKSPRTSTIRPRNASTFPTNYGRRVEGGQDGGGGGGRGFLRLVRDSGNSSAATSASGRRQRQDPWLADDGDNVGQRRRRPLDGRRGRETDGHGGAALVRVPVATATATGPPSKYDHTATRYSEYDSGGGGGGGEEGGGGSAPERRESEDGDDKERFMRRPSIAAAPAAAPAAAASSSASHAYRDRDPGRGFGGGGTGGEGPSLSGLRGLASSRGSFGSSSLRSSGTRRRVELRTPAEEEAVRKSQEMSSSLTALRKSSTNVDGYCSSSSFRHANSRGEGRKTETVGEEGPPPEGDEEARRTYASSSAGAEDKRGQRQSSTAAAPPAVEDARAGREISDIDRRLGELHDFLKRAKEGGLGALPLPPPPPPPPPPTTSEARLFQSPSIGAPSAAIRPPLAAAAAVDESALSSGSTAAAAAESARFELREEKTRSPPPAADARGQAGGLQSKNESGSRGVDKDDAGVVQD